MASRKNTKTTVLTISFLCSLVCSETDAQTMKEYLSTPEGFYYWFGALNYELKTCGFPLPEKAIDAFATRAGVTKKMVVEQGGSTIQEAYAATKAATDREGVDAMCRRIEPEIKQLTQQGIYK